MKLEWMSMAAPNSLANRCVAFRYLIAVNADAYTMVSDIKLANPGAMVVKHVHVAMSKARFPAITRYARARMEE